MEIARYLADVCANYSILDKIQLNTEVRKMEWDSAANEWVLTISSLLPGADDWSQSQREQKLKEQKRKSAFIYTYKIRAQVVVTCVGGLVEPKSWPSSVPGIETFQGKVIHAARWESDIDLKDKDVVVIGTGSSAAQIVPAILQSEYDVKSVTQLMRTAPWIQPPSVTDNELRVFEKWSHVWFKRVPFLQKLLRAFIFWRMELDWFQVFKDGFLSKIYRPATERVFLDYMRKTAPEAYHRVLTPDYEIGCKRRVTGSAWLKSLHSPKLNLYTNPLLEVKPSGVLLGPQRDFISESKSAVINADVIILANGYKTNEWLLPLEVIGSQGKSIHQVWKEAGGARAYLGTAVHEFPNFFMINGPNIATGHSSIIFQSENAVKYCSRIIQPILSGHISVYEIQKEAEDHWTRKVQEALKSTAFRPGGCSSWYINENGWNSTTYP